MNTSAAEAHQVLSDATAEERHALAPTGVLRVGLYRGSPSSILEGTNGEASRGVGYLLGRAFAQQLGVEFERHVHAKNADVLNAMERGLLDLVFTNATAARTRFIDFSPTVLEIEKSILVTASSAYDTLEALHGLPVKIGVNVGSSTGTELATVFPRASLEPVPTLEQAASWLASAAIDGFATNKAILFELADQLPGSRVLAGAWGAEHFALGIPKGRAVGRPFLDRFACRAESSGLLAKAVASSRIRGTGVKEALMIPGVARSEPG
jgi:polar amino acid transport system substrate-binding protein